MSPKIEQSEVQIDPANPIGTPPRTQALGRSKKSPPQQTNPSIPPNNPRDPLGSERDYDRAIRPTTDQSRDGGAHQQNLHKSKLGNTENNLGRAGRR